MSYIQIYHLLLCHILSTHFIIHMFCCFMRYFQCFSSPFFAVIIMSICTHSHGSTKHWWHSSWSIVWYMLTSTKISFVETLCSYDEMHVSVISQVTSYSYRLYFYVNILSMTLYAVWCDMFFSVQHIYKSSYDIFEQIWYVYVVWQHSYVSMYICIYQWLLYLILTYILLLSYVAFFNSELSSAIMWTVICYCVEYSYLVSYISFS